MADAQVYFLWYYNLASGKKGRPTSILTPQTRERPPFFPRPPMVKSSSLTCPTQPAPASFRPEKTMRMPALRRENGLLLATTLLVLGCGSLMALGAEDAAKPPAAGAFSAEAVEFFETRVRPVLAESCVRCHGEKKQSSELRLDSRQAVLDGGASGPAMVPGNPDESLLIQAIRQTHDEIKMPPKEKLPDAALDALSSWVKMGAPWSEGTIPTVVTRDQTSRSHWAFQPVRVLDPPAVKDADWVATPVDAFILERLEKEGLRPSPRADRRTLIRRATFDLTGQPPTPAEVEEFVADPSPLAFTTVVDRLLASPRYGERWGRFWLDVARYADTRGYVLKAERRYPYSYTYRDYVIRSFNDDVPYDRFLTEQIAADQLDLGNDRRPLAALGFLTVGRRNNGDINEIIDDRIDVVGRGLLGLTVACARCHDHKFDPIPTEDYYSLYGVFASSVDPKELPVIAAVETSAATRDFERQLHEREQKRDQLVAKLKDEFKADVRSRIALYVKAAFDLDFNSNGRSPKLDERARADKLHPGRLRGVMIRWQESLAAAGQTPDPIFTPWRTLAALPAGDFAAKAATLVHHWAESGAEVHPLVARALAGGPPATMADVATCYGALLAEAEGRWQECLKKDPAASALEDADWEALRLVLYAPDGPIATAPDASPRLFDRKERESIEALAAKIDELQVTHAGAPPRAMVLNDLPQPVNPQVFLRGSPGRRGKSVPRQFLEVLSGPERRPFAHGSGRRELAQAIVQPDNPLTARVMVNRIWLNHFGSGLVGTPSDFGLRSDPPTHPELLDYLAGAFIRGGWSVKAMHRLIMLSSAYQQRSDNRRECLERDPENRLVWKFNRRRLDFEATRDALLAVSSRLDTTMGGRSVSLAAAPFTPRRTVYGFVDRQNLDGLFRTFDFASPDTTSPRRHVTTVPQQALFLLNNAFVVEQVRSLAGRLEPAAADPEARVRQLYALLFGRAPAPRELALGVAFTQRQAAPERLAAELSPWEEYAQVLLLTNEFAFVD